MDSLRGGDHISRDIEEQSGSVEANTTKPTDGAIKIELKGLLESKTQAP